MMSESKQQAYALLRAWKGENYVFGIGVMDQLGQLVRRFGTRALVVSSGRHSQEKIRQGLDSLAQAGVSMVTDVCVPGAKPNAPRQVVLPKPEMAACPLQGQHRLVQLLPGHPVAAGDIAAVFQQQLHQGPVADSQAQHCNFLPPQGIEILVKSVHLRCLLFISMGPVYPF